MWYKSCPRCITGDVVLGRDEYGWHLQCVQCAYIKDLNNRHEASAVLHELRLPNLAATLAA